MLWGCRHQEDPSPDSKGYACMSSELPLYDSAHHHWSTVFTDMTVLSSGHDIMLAQECSEETWDQQWNGSLCHARSNKLSPSTRMRWRNTTPTMGWQPTLGPTYTKWIGRPPRQEKWKGITGREGYWKPCTFINSSTPPTWTVVWQSIPPGYRCWTNPHTPDTFFQTYSSPDLLIWFTSFFYIFSAI